VRVAFNAISPDDRERNVVRHPRALLGGKQITGGQPEQRHGRCLVGRRAAGGVNYCRDAGERRVEAIAGGQVHAQGAADANDIVPFTFKDSDGTRADVAGGADDRDPHDRHHHLPERSLRGTGSVVERSPAMTSPDAPWRQ
jgi:hypothetical protein